MKWQQELFERFKNLASKAALTVKRTLREQRIFDPIDNEEIDANAKLALAELIADKGTQEHVAAYFKRGLMELFVRHEVQRVQRAHPDRVRTKSLHTKTGRYREFVDTRPNWSEPAILAELECPHADAVRRLYINGETVDEVFPTTSERMHWYRIQLPEVRAYFTKLYPEWAKGESR